MYGNTKNENEDLPAADIIKQQQHKLERIRSATVGGVGSTGGSNPARKLSAYDLRALLSTGDGLDGSAAAASSQLYPNRETLAAATDFFTPLKDWAKYCQQNDNNCLQEYYRAMSADNRWVECKLVFGIVGGGCGLQVPKCCNMQQADVHV